MKPDEVYNNWDIDEETVCRFLGTDRDASDGPKSKHELGFDVFMGPDGKHALLPEKYATLGPADVYYNSLDEAGAGGSSYFATSDLGLNRARRTAIVMLLEASNEGRLPTEFGNFDFLLYLQALTYIDRKRRD